MSSRSASPLRPVRQHVVQALLASALVLATLPTLLPVGAADAGLEQVGEFRPFGANVLADNFEFSNAVDPQRRNWFFVAAVDPATGPVANSRVWQFNLDRRAQVGKPLQLGGGPTQPVITAVDRDRGHLWHIHGASGSEKIAVVEATPGGPRLVKEWAIGSGLDGSGGAYRLLPRGLEIVGGKAYLAAAPSSLIPVRDTALVQLDVARLLAGGDPIDWRYGVTKCANLPFLFVPTAVGVSRTTPTVSLGCRALRSGAELQGVVVVEMPSMAPSTSTGFTEAFYPISGNYEKAESFYDPVSERIAMRRAAPAQLVVFDIRNRHWMRPVLFGQSNLWQSGIDDRTGRIYGQGNDPDAGGNGAFIYVPELRPTPPQNGLVHAFPIDPGDPSGRMAIDSAKGELFVADSDVVRDPVSGAASPRGLFFRIYRDSRPAADASRASDPDKEIINLSGEAQGYGARVSYVGGVGGTYSNAVNTEYVIGTTVAPGTRHITFARTVRMRLTEGDTSAEATVSHPESAAAAEAGRAPGGWPHDPVACRDFGNAPSTARDSSGRAEVECDTEYPKVASRAVYEAKTDDPFAAPVQRAATSAATTISRTKGVTTIVTSEGSLELPGLVSIGRMRATAITYAAGTEGTAQSVYEREMNDVRIAGQPYCDVQCDPDDVAREINQRFGGLAANGVMVVADAPDPDPGLRGSDGGVQSIVQRDSWAHEEDVGVHDYAEDKYEHPAFTITVYQDRRYPQHEIYSLAGVQAVSRLPQALADDLDDLAGPDDDPAATGFSSGLSGGSSGSLADFGAPTRPPGSSLSAPRARRTSRGTGVGLAERMAWTVASPLRSPATLAIFAFFAVPVYLASRRWLLLSYRPAEAGDTDAT